MSFYLGTAKSRHQPSLSTKMIPTGLGQRTTLIVEEAQADPQIIDPENELSALISPSATSKPVSMAVMPKKKAAVAPRRPYQLDAAQRMAWEQYLCHYPPLGYCRHPQSEGSVYCRAHSCRAINDDGNRCCNLVPNPTRSQYCRTGWHNETATYSPVEDLKAARKARDSILASEREIEHAEHVSYFSTHFSIALASSSSTSSTGSSSSGNPPNSDPKDPPPADRYRSTSLEHESGWGAFGIDKWWVGEWSRTQTPSAPATSALEGQ